MALHGKYGDFEFCILGYFGYIYIKCITETIKQNIVVFIHRE
jgi:hypothetical protein